MSDDGEPEVDVTDVVREFGIAISSVIDDFKESFQKVFDDAEYRFDKELGKQIAKHPDLYADLKRTAKKLKRDWDKTSREWGMK
jgi:hypothetical protein